MNDQQLLHQFVTQHSQPAFRQLVERHTLWLYSVCLRRLRDPALAEDATQAIFLALAQKAPALLHEPTLSPWLHQVAKFVAANLLRAQTRRTRHESEAAAMTPTTTPSSDWHQIEPDLEPALDRLPFRDRQILLLRFYEQKSHPQIAATLRISEPAAAKRLERALDRLRTLLLPATAPTTTPLSSTALSSLLLAHTVFPAPATLATATATTTSLAKGALTAKATAKLQPAAIALAAACLLIAVPTYLLILHHGAPTPPPSFVATPPSPPTTTPASPSPTTADSPDAFAKAYSLPPGQIVRRITDAPPEIRDPFVHKTFQTAPFSRGAILIGWAGAAMSNTSYWAAAPSYPLSFLAQQMFNIPPTEIEGDLLQRTITGDFVYDQKPYRHPPPNAAPPCKKSSPTNSASPRRSSSATSPEKSSSSAATGTSPLSPTLPRSQPSPAALPSPASAIYRDDQFDPQSQNNFSTTAPSSALISQLTSYLHQQVLIEADGLPPLIAYRLQSSRSTRRPVKFTSEIRDQILQHLTEQTTLTWTEETRTVPRLFLRISPTP